MVQSVPSIKFERAVPQRWEPCIVCRWDQLVYLERSLLFSHEVGDANQASVSQERNLLQRSMESRVLVVELAIMLY